MSVRVITDNGGEIPIPADVLAQGEIACGAYVEKQTKSKASAPPPTPKSPAIVGANPEE